MAMRNLVKACDLEPGVSERSQLGQLARRARRRSWRARLVSIERSPKIAFRKCSSASREILDIFTSWCILD